MPTKELMKIKKIFDNMKEEYGLNRTDILILSLCKDGFNNAYEIADTGEIDRGLVSRALKKLEAEKWIIRSSLLNKKRYTEVTKKTIEVLDHFKEMTEYERNTDNNDYTFIHGIYIGG